ncbi:MAG: hypothetical protein U5L03_11460 [Burkholderiaceae bacterium]|nr:hypothetical protein [Burkholderiaceae bacterium]
MRWTLVVPGALVPAPIAADVIAAARAPHLARLIARARIDAPQPASTATLGAAHWGWLWQRFAGRDDVPVTAPAAWHALDASDRLGDADPGTLWQAEPIHFAVARDHMLALPLTDADALDPAESATLVATAQSCAHAAGAQVHILDNHWFMRFDAPWQLQAAPLDVALAASIQDRLPQGADRARWRRLLTEIQIAWHHHAVNAAREERGARAVNGLWLHGGGRLPALPPCGLTQVACDEPAVRGWARAAGVPPVSVATLASELVPHGDALAVWPHLFAACKADAWHPWLAALAAFDAWLAPLAQRGQAAGAQIELVLCGRTQTRSIVINGADRWRRWRQADLASTVGEPPLEAM